MWEAIEHGANAAGSYTIFRGRDAEGEACYAWTQNRLGMTVEPSGVTRYYDLAYVRQCAAETQELYC